VAKGCVVEFGEVEQGGLRIADEFEAGAFDAAGLKRDPEGEQAGHVDGRAGQRGKADAEGSVLVPVLDVISVLRGAGRRLVRGRFSAQPGLIEVEGPGRAEGCDEERLETGCGERREQFLSAAQTKVEERGEKQGIGDGVVAMALGEGSLIVDGFEAVIGCLLEAGEGVAGEDIPQPGDARIAELRCLVVDGHVGGSLVEFGPAKGNIDCVPARRAMQASGLDASVSFAAKWRVWGVEMVGARGACCWYFSELATAAQGWQVGELAGTWAGLRSRRCGADGVMWMD